MIFLKITVQFFLTVLFRQTVGFLGASVLFDGERAKPVDGLKETRFVFVFYRLVALRRGSCLTCQRFFDKCVFFCFLDKTAKTAKIITHA